MTPDPEVVKALKEIETTGLPLADWYESVFSFISCSDTPDKFAQAAQSARELMEKVSEVVVSAQETQNDAKSTLTKLAESFAKAKRNSSAFVTDDWIGGIDRSLHRFLSDFASSVGQKSDRGSSRQGRLEQSHAIFQGRIPNPAQSTSSESKQIGKRWQKLFGYFIGAAHHRPSVVDEEKFIAKVNELTEFLRVLVTRVPFETEQELDALIAEVEGHD